MKHQRVGVGVEVGRDSQDEDTWPEEAENLEAVEAVVEKRLSARLWGGRMEQSQGPRLH